MHARKLIALTFAVALLAALAWWQTRREAGMERARERALCEGFDPARVTAIRVDNLERSLQLRLVRRDDGRFHIADPIDFPADMAVVELLLDMLATQRATPSAYSKAADLALDPPRVVLEVEERLGVSTHVRRIEVGAPDLDQQHVFVRSEGEIVRTERGLETTLERDLPDWRERAILRTPLRSVVEIARRGSITFPGESEPASLDLDMLLDGEFWRATHPFFAQLDENAVEILLAGAALVRAAGFVDTPGDRGHYGLDRPQISFALVDGAGKRETVRLAPQPGRELWYCDVEGSPYVYEVPFESVVAVSAPTPGLVDRRLVSAPRERVAAVRVTLGGDGERTELALERRGGQWLATARAGERTLLDRVDADAARAGDFVGAIELARTSEIFFDRAWDASAKTGEVALETTDGDRQGGELGPLVRASDGTESVLFRRFGDGLVAALDPALVARLRVDPASLRSLELHKVPELQVARIHVRRGDTELVYARSERGRWSRQGSEGEAKDFARLVDRLLSMRASEILARGIDDRVERAIEVRIVALNGVETTFTLGWMQPAGATAESPVYRSPEKLGRVAPELIDDVAELFPRD